MDKISDAVPRPAALTQECMSFILFNRRIEEHISSCYTVVVSLDHPFDCIINGQPLTGIHGFVARQGISHSFRPQSCTMLVCMVQVHSLYGRQLRLLLSNKAFLNLGPMQDPDLTASVLLYGHAELSDEQLLQSVDALLSSVCSISEFDGRLTVDKRVEQCLPYIEDRIHLPLLLEDIALQMGLSKGRARHLFVEQTGIGFSQYVITRRIHRTISAAASEKTRLKKTCIRFGFTDHAHFSHIFKRNVGITPGVLLRSCRLLL